MANDSPELKALSSPSEQTPPSLLDEALNHSRETWKNVTTGNASAGQYAEAAAEALTVTAVGAFLYTRNRNLANSFVENVDSTLQFSDYVANPALLAQIRATAKSTETLPGMAGKPGTLGLHEREELSIQEIETHNRALLARYQATAKGTEQTPLNQILVHPDTGAPMLRPLHPQSSRLDALTEGLPEEINFGDEAANQILSKIPKQTVVMGHVHGTPEGQPTFSALNLDKINTEPNFPPPPNSEVYTINSIVKRNME